MSLSIGPIILTLLIAQRLFKFSRINNHPQWEAMFRYVRYFAIFLFIAEVVLDATDTVRWIWHVIIVSLLVFAFRQKEMHSLRMFLVAFIPYAAVSLLRDLTMVVLSNFYNGWRNYFETANLLSVIWLIAILFSNHRQYIAAEKERVRRQKEEDINREIAKRKVELEVLVVERTTEITRQKEELEQTLHELQAMQDQLIQSEKMASLGELTAGIAHEIQNPLNFVNNFSEVSSELLDELKEALIISNREEALEIADYIRQNLDKIIHHGKRADSIVKGMLQHSRSNIGIKELTDINALADEYLRLSYHGLRAKDKSFNAGYKLERDDSLQKIKVVPQDIGRVLLNLINNAFYAVSKKAKENIAGYKPEVTVGISKINNKVNIMIKDNGIGIPLELKDKIFQPFFTTKPAGQGTGLGLSISYDIITKGHSGEITVHSNAGEGTEFIITIPVSI